MPHANANGISIFFETRGSGPAVLVIPGLGLEVSDIDRLIDDLARRCTVTAMDNRGCGRTSHPPGPYSIPQMADDTAALMDQLGTQRPVVLGISMGAKVALDLAIRRPERVARLILVGAQFRARRHTPLPVRVSRALRVLGLGRGHTPQTVAAFNAQARASATYDCSDRVDGIRTPTLILHGERDRVAPFAQAQELAARIPGARLVALPGGHLSFLFSGRDTVVREAIDFASS